MSAAADGGGSGDGNRWRNSKLKPVQEVIALRDATTLEKLDALHAQDLQDADVLNLCGFG